jgi:hypothetical protein
MTTTQEKLEVLFAKVRKLPEPRQQDVLDALIEIAEDGVYVLSDDERAILEPALADAKRDENLIDAERLDLLTRPWG